MAGTIGIKIANGDFYPITMENSPSKKSLILTTVHDRQTNVQIDLFRSNSKSMLDAQYIGSLVVENVKPKPKGEPSIEMIISSNTDGNITAEAHDLEPGSQRYSLDVSLKTLDTKTGENDFPDFDLEENASASPAGLYRETGDTDDEEKKFPWLIMGLATIFVIIAIALLWFFFLGGRDVLPLEDIFTFTHDAPAAEYTLPPPPVIQTPPAPPMEPAPVVQAPEPAAPAQLPPVQAAAVTPPPVIQAPVSPPPARPESVTAARKRPPAPVSSYKVPAVIPKNGVVYQIRWGDTLWDISQAFYRNPWLYPKIAKYNNIKNPDLIISGFNVRIPPKE